MHTPIDWHGCTLLLPIAASLGFKRLLQRKVTHAVNAWATGLTCDNTSTSCWGGSDD